MHFYEQENSKVTFVYFAFTLRPYQRGAPHSLRTTAACNVSQSLYYFRMLSSTYLFAVKWLVR